MSDPTPTKPIDDAISNTSSTLAERIENIKSAQCQYSNFCHNPTSARVRYMSILIVNDQVENITVKEIVDECIEIMNTHSSDFGYITLVLEYIIQQILVKKYGMPERAKEIKEVIRLAEKIFLLGKDAVTLDAKPVIRSPFYESFAINTILRLDPHLRPRKGPLSGLRYR